MNPQNKPAPPVTPPVDPDANSVRNIEGFVRRTTVAPTTKNYRPRTFYESIILVVDNLDNPTTGTLYVFAGMQKSTKTPKWAQLSTTIV